MDPIALGPNAGVVRLAPSAPCGRVGVPHLANGVERTWTSPVGRRRRQRGTHGCGRSRDATRVGNAPRRSNPPGAWFDRAETRPLPRIVTGEDTWCQLFSEPGSGSDLAGLTTTAVQDGAVFVVNGQKVWSTSAHHADLGMLLARTDWDAPKHKGDLVDGPAHAPAGRRGSTAAPDERHTSFNEVFLSDAEVPVDNVVGRLGEGWGIALTTLAHEARLRLGAAQRPRIRGKGHRGSQAEADEYFATYSWYPQRAGRVDLIAEHARLTARNGDAVSRQAIAGLTALQRAHRGRPTGHD